MGESVLKSHMKAEKHKVNIQQLQTKSMVTISSFFKKSTGDDLKEKETVPLVAADMAIPHPPANLNMTVSKSASLESYVTKDDVLKSEILWTLKLVTSHQSYKSSEDTNKLFKTMFPDSNIAKQFTCGERKASYMSVFGLAEHFLKLLKTSIRGPFVILFDESLNQKMQEKQMDVLTRYWHHEKNKVQTRYYTSQFLGKYITLVNYFHSYY